VTTRWTPGCDRTGRRLAEGPSGRNHGLRFRDRRGAGRNGGGLAVVVLVAAVFVYLWRLVSWPASLETDAWAYTVWAKALLRGEPVLYSYLPTTPKPMAIALAAMASPITAERSFGVVVVVGLAGLAASLFTAGLRQRGAFAGMMAVAAFAFLPHLNEVIAYGLVDAVVAALVVAALASRGAPRLLCLILAGLLRPEAWLLSALAGATETRGPARRRAAAAAFCGVLPAALWSATDLALTGDPLASYHRARAIINAFTLGGYRPPTWSQIPGSELHAIAAAAGPFVAIAGAIGLTAHVCTSWRGRSLDPLLAGAVAVWTLAPAIEMHSAPTPLRYYLPLAALLALGCGLLAGNVARDKIDIPILAAVGAIAAIVTATTIMAYPHNGRSARQAAATTESIPAIDQALRCGPLRVIGLRPPNQNHPVAYISELADRTDQSLRDFAPSDDYYAAVLLIHGSSSPLPPWPRTRIPLGILALRPRCPRITAAIPKVEGVDRKEAQPAHQSLGRTVVTNPPPLRGSPKPPPATAAGHDPAAGTQGQRTTARHAADRERNRQKPHPMNTSATGTHVPSAEAPAAPPATGCRRRPPPEPREQLAPTCRSEWSAPSGQPHSLSRSRPTSSRDAEALPRSNPVWQLRGRSRGTRSTPSQAHSSRSTSG
jgi:hypothetical protein